MTEFPLAIIHRAAAYLKPGAPHFNLPFNMPMAFPHCRFYEYTEQDILDAFDYDFPQQQKCSSRAQVRELKAAHAPSRLQFFRAVYGFGKTYMPELFAFKADLGLTKLSYQVEKITFGSFGASMVCPVCHMSFDPGFIATALVGVSGLHDYNNIDQYLLWTRAYLRTPCLKAYLQHLACEKLRLMGVLSRPERFNAKRRAVLNELIVRALNALSAKTAHFYGEAVPAATKLVFDDSRIQLSDTEQPCPRSNSASQIEQPSCEYRNFSEGSTREKPYYSSMIVPPSVPQIYNIESTADGQPILYYKNSFYSAEEVSHDIKRVHYNVPWKPLETLETSSNISLAENDAQKYPEKNSVNYATVPYQDYQSAKYQAQVIELSSTSNSSCQEVPNPDYGDAKQDYSECYIHGSESLRAAYLTLQGFKVKNPNAYLASKENSTKKEEYSKSYDMEYYT